MSLSTRAPLVLLAALALTACSSSTGEPTSSSIALPSPAPAGDAGQIGAFCALVVEGQDYESDTEAAELWESMNNAIATATTDDDPSAIAAIRAWGAYLEVAVDEFIPVYEQLLSITDDPLLRRAIEITTELHRDLGATAANSFANVTSIAEYNTLQNSVFGDTLAAYEDPDDREALLYFDDYILENCGVSTTTDS
jgi:hypothetical protein